MNRRNAALGERTYIGAVLNGTCPTVPEEFLMAIAWWFCRFSLQRQHFFYPWLPLFTKSLGTIAASNKAQSKLLWELLGLSQLQWCHHFCSQGMEVIGEKPGNQGGGYGLKISSGSDIFIQRQKKTITLIGRDLASYRELGRSTEVKLTGGHQLGPKTVAEIWSREVVVSQGFLMYWSEWRCSLDHAECPL